MPFFALRWGSAPQQGKQTWSVLCACFRGDVADLLPEWVRQNNLEHSGKDLRLHSPGLYEIGSVRGLRAPLLDRDQILRLDQIYLRAMREIGRLRASHPDLGHHIVLPRLPNALSESIAADMAPDLFGSGADPARPLDLGDLDVLTAGDVRRRVAVKGTGKTRWITITKTDLSADCLVWVDYSTRLANGTPEIDVWLFDQIVSEWTDQRKLTMRQAVALHGLPARRYYAL